MTSLFTEEYVSARKALLAKEKELTKLKDEIAEARRALPRIPVPTDRYEFIDSRTSAKLSILDLFDGRSQLIVQHFMFSKGSPRGEQETGEGMEISYIV